MLRLPVRVEGTSVMALVDTGCPATIVSKELCRQILDREQENDREHLSLGESRRRAAERLQLSKPRLQLRAYCGTILPIGAEITVHISAPGCQCESVVLVQEETEVEV